MTTTTPHQLRLFGKTQFWTDDDDGDQLVGQERQIVLSLTPCVRMLRLMAARGLDERGVLERAINAGLRAMENEQHG